MRRARAITYGVVALLAVGAIYFTTPLPPGAAKPVGEILSAEHAAHLWRERYDTVGRGETLTGVLARGGLSEVIAREAMKTAKMLDPRRIPEGMQVVVRNHADDTLQTEVVLRLAIDRLLRIKRDSVGWSAQEERLPWKTDTVAVDAVIKTNLYEAMDLAAYDALPKDVREALTYALADVFEYRVDMSRDLRVGDSFRVLAERKVGPQGAVKIGAVIAATARLSGSITEVTRYHSAKVGGEYFDAEGRSMRAGFLRAPLEFRRISSVFGTRVHPILGTVRKHQGTDYAANAGTPVRAIGDGVVVKAGWSNGYGNVVELRHPNGFVTRYGHMRGFGPSIHVGARVTQKQTIGYVGSTGLSTGPHLHFEVIVNGVQRDPRTALANQSSEPVPASERPAFAAVRTNLQAMLANTPLLASTTSASAAQN
ncbi:MAG TPA: M23 family metallopeptidase [Gemmatimonadaceae bacterium]|nr:M23 family metallopeptidase [Gemmatimonadaceae bacterium]